MFGPRLAEPWIFVLYKEAKAGSHDVLRSCRTANSLGMQRSERVLCNLHFARIAKKNILAIHVKISEQSSGCWNQWRTLHSGSPNQCIFIVITKTIFYVYILLLDRSKLVFIYTKVKKYILFYKRDPKIVDNIEL